MLKIKPIELRDANLFISNNHRHHKPVIGHRFSLSCWNDDVIVGVCIVGRPVSRRVNASSTLEVTRLCTNGYKNACSILYAAAARVGKEMGYSKIQTYILESELGTTLKAAGWKFETTTQGGHWVRSNGDSRRKDQPTCPKQRWAKLLN